MPRLKSKLKTIEAFEVLSKDEAHRYGFIFRATSDGLVMPWAAIHASPGGPEITFHGSANEAWRKIVDEEMMRLGRARKQQKARS